MLAVNSMAISPDGRSIAIVAQGSSGQPSLYIRSLDSVETREVPGTTTANSPFWSPDGRTIAFFADRKLKKIDVAGGPAQVICDAGINAVSGSWSNAGMIVFSSNNVLHRVSVAGGETTVIRELDASLQESGAFSPSFLPDGHHFLYTIWSPRESTRGIYVGSVDSKETTRISPTPFDGRLCQSWLPPLPK
jgi:Tol biopolymer transport system component